MLSVVMLNVILMSVMAPACQKVFHSVLQDPRLSHKIRPGYNFIVRYTNICNKLECLSLASFTSLI